MKNLMKTMLLTTLFVLLLCSTVGCSHALVSNTYDEKATPSQDYRVDTPAKSVSLKVSNVGVPEAPAPPGCPAPVPPVEKKVRVKKLPDGRIVVQVIVTEGN